ncbi:MAG: amidohydrolase family protein [Anaerolineaceae bacterium]|nr:amidohydrolase family protein [Anaerolineaceae bacterium]
MYDLTLLGSTLVSPRGRFRADVGVKNGLIAVIADDLSLAKTERSLRLDDQYVLPGAIDSHMHLWEAGFVSDPDFASGTRTALAGGITTIIDQPLTPPEVLDAQVFRSKLAIGERTSYIDFALHGGVGHDNLSELAGMWQAGCTAFKVFMSDSGCKVAALSDGELLAAFREIGRLGGLVLIHAENEAMLQYNQARLQSAGRRDPQAFLDWRPPEVEYEAIQRALHLLQDTGARAVFLHTTLPEGVDLIHKARHHGLDVYVETCPHNLVLTTADFGRQGPWITFAPPVRDPRRAADLWQRLAAGQIHTMGSDHGAVAKSLKEIGYQDIWQSLFSVPDAETFVCLMLNRVSQGKFTLERLAAVQSENPSRLYGLFPQKGVIQVGSDADFTIVDLKPSYHLRAAEMETACGWIPYEGMQITGKVTHTIVRGAVLMENGTINGRPGFGKFIRRGVQYSF